MSQVPGVKELNFSGQIVTLDLVSSSLTLNIREPFFYAGQKYGWAGDPVGIGINEGIINYARSQLLELRFTVGDNSPIYCADPVEWALFCEKHHSKYRAGNTWLLVYPFSKCDVGELKRDRPVKGGLDHFL